MKVYSTMTLSNIKVKETGSTIFPDINEENIQLLIKDVFKGGKFNADAIFFGQHTLVFMAESRP
jgi:hypothetical protein